MAELHTETPNVPAVHRATPPSLLRVAVCLIVAQLAFRAWVVYGSWFYFDDFVFAGRSYKLPLSWSFLMDDYGGHRMPGALLATWLLTRLAPLSWPVAATLMLLAQAVASFGCWRMLRALFGERPLNLVWLTVYLFSPVTIAAFLWWAAAINQLPFQVAFFFGITAHVTYLRTRRLRHALAAAAWFLFGLVFYEKTILLLGVYAFLTLGYFASGSPLARVRSVLARYWRAVALYGVVGAGFAGLYVATADPRPAVAKGDVPVLDVGLNMIGKTLLPGLLGGPWTWTPLGPDSLSAPPGWLWAAAVLVTGVTIGASLTQRVRAGRAWVFWACYLAAMVALVTQNRAGAVGPLIGLVYRYVTDGVMVTVLVLGLAFCAVPGAVESSAPSDPAERGVRPSPARAAVFAAAVLALVASCLWNSAVYAHRWHTQNAAKTYFAHARSDVDRYGGDQVIGDGELPETIVWKVSTPWNLASNMLAPAGIRFDRRVTDRLMVFDETGHLRPAVVAAQVRGTRTGSGCGITGEVRIGLTGEVFDPGNYWLRIGYIASGDTPVRVRIGDVSVDARLDKGLHALFVPAHGTPTTLELTGLKRTVQLCIGDDVQVGPPVVGLG